MEKIICKREPGGPVVYGVGQDWVYHSPTGFAWGYGGSGPADLALNILLAVTKDRDTAWQYHQDFKVEDIKKWLKERGWKE